MSMNKESVKKSCEAKMGRPPLYKSEFALQAFNYCLLGATDADLAIFFEVQESTVNNWKNKYPDFLESIKKGKDLADAEIARRLFDRAKGVTINVQQAFKVKTITYNEEGKRCEVESIEVVNLQQEQAPDTTAGIFWLKNRSRNWRDKKEVDTNLKSISVSVIDDDTQKSIQSIRERLSNEAD